MRALPRRNMFRLAQPIMIGCVAALGTALRAEGALPLLSPGLRPPRTRVHSLASLALADARQSTLRWSALPAGSTAA